MNDLESMTIEEAKLLATMNRWWGLGEQGWDEGRRKLMEMFSQVDLEVEIRSLTSLIKNLQYFSEPFTFEPRETGGWVFYKKPGETNAIIVPGDHRRFEAGNVMTIVYRMFEGFDIIPREVSFERVYRACHLQEVEPTKYWIASRGYLLLRGLPNPGLPQPPSYESLVQQKGIV